MERNKIIAGISIMIFTLGCITLLTACSKDSSTSPSEFTISVPGDETVEAYGGPLAWQDQVVSVRDITGKPRQGMKVTVYEHGGFGNFYTDNTFSTPLPSPYSATTDDFGTIKINYTSAGFGCGTEDVTFTLGYRVQSGAIWSTHTDTITVKKCP